MAPPSQQALHEYHPHVHGRTAAQVCGGLAGVLLIAEDAERALGLPSDYGVDDLPLVIQDRQFADGRLIVAADMMTMMQGRGGNTLLVNGTPNAVASVPARRVRLRLVNGSNARIYSLSFDDQRAFQWIAAEGGLLEAPVELRSLSLAPGERAELLVDFSDGRSAMLVTGQDANAFMMMGGMGRLRDGVASAFPSEEQAVLAFEPSGAPGSAAPVPSRLAERARTDASRAVKRRQFVLNTGMGGMIGGGMGSMRGSGMGSGAINGRTFDMNRVDERVRLGDTEIWDVSGEMMAHPFHVHGVHFEVLGRDGRAPDVRDQGLRDTVLVKEPVDWNAVTHALHGPCRSRVEPWLCALTHRPRQHVSLDSPDHHGLRSLFGTAVQEVVAVEESRGVGLALPEFAGSRDALSVSCAPCRRVSVVSSFSVGKLMKTLFAMAVGTVPLLVTGVALAQSGSMMDGSAWGMGWMGGYGGIWGPILLVVVIAGLVALVMQRRGK